MLFTMADQNAVQRVERQLKPVLAHKLAPQLLDAKVAGAPEAQNKRLLLSKHLLPRQVLGTPAFLAQSADAMRLISAPPLPEGEMPQRRQTRPASPSCSYSLTQPRRVLTSMLGTPPKYPSQAGCGQRAPSVRSTKPPTLSRLINWKAMDRPETQYNRRSKSETMSPNPTLDESAALTNMPTPEVCKAPAPWASSPAATGRGSPW
jgi:hypothetical protein